MALKTNFFQAPYFDDYYEDGGAQENNYVRILYRPAFAVQARELTQTQTILQDQVRRFGDHVFKNGSLVTGGGFDINDEYQYVKVDQDASTIEDRIGDTLEGQDSGVRADILDVQSTDADQTIVYVEYIKSGDSDKVFRDGENLDFIDIGIDPLTAIDTDATGETILFQIEAGVLYVNGFFIQFETQSILVSLTDSDGVDADVGFVVDENIVTPEEDNQLLDNATGSPTFTAPGAHRYQITLGLAVSEPAETENQKNFFMLAEIRDGEEYHKRDVPQYAEIQKQQNRKTFDLQGHAAIDPFGVQVKEHLKTSGNGGVFSAEDGGDHQMLVAKISPGRAYIRGRNIRFSQSQLVEFDKGVETGFETDISFTSSLGNYFVLNEVAGEWCQTCVPVSLRDAPLTAVSGATEPYNIDVDANSNEIGTALFYVAQYQSGSPGQSGAEYRVYVFDIQMTSGKIEDVRSVVAGTNPESIGDVVLEEVSGFTNPQAKVQETNLRSLVYELPEDYVKTLRDVDNNITSTFVYNDKYDVNVSNGQFTITPNESDEIYPYGDTISQIEANEIIVTDDLGNILEIDAAGSSVTSTSLDIALTTSYDGSAVVTAPVQKQNVREARKNILRDRLVKIDVDTHSSTREFNLGFSDVFRIVKITRGSDYSLNNQDITDWFDLKDGQNDAFYDHGSIRLKEGRTLDAGDKLVVQLDYFEHDFSQGIGYFSIDSYPIDDVNLDEPTAIQTWEVPNFESRRQGVFSLAESVDFRNRIDDSATDTTDLTSATVNPSTNNTFLVPSAGLINISPNTSFSTDIEYYLGYYLLIALNKDREVVTRHGPSDKNPQVPEKLEEEMDIAVIEITPYPSLSPDFANQVNKTEFAVDKRTLSNRAYQHKDVEKIDQRVQRLENQVNLNQLETDAKDKSIVNDEGLNQFKTGFITDLFTDHDLGQFNAAGYDCSIGSRQERLGPAFDLNNIQMRLDTTTNTNRD